MPNRTIKDRARRSPSLDALSAEAERLFWRLMLAADDYGRFEADPRILLAECFALKVGEWSPARVAKWYAELERGDDPIVLTYVVRGRRFGVFRKFENEPRAKSSKYPAPPVDPWGASLLLATGEHLNAAAQHVRADAPQVRADAPVTETVTVTETETEDGSERAEGASPPAGLLGNGHVADDEGVDPKILTILAECPHLALLATSDEATADFWDQVIAAAEPYGVGFPWMNARLRHYDGWFRDHPERRSRSAARLRGRIRKWLTDDLEKLAVKARA